MHKLLRTGTARRNPQKGFTAMEIAMVATVIAILAVIVIPIYRNRVDEAKIAAAKADLTSLMKAEMLAQADTGFYFRLEDLDNVQAPAPDVPPADGVDTETPIIAYLSEVTDTTPPEARPESPNTLTLPLWKNLAGTRENPKFKGPYTSFNRTERYRELFDAFGATLFRGPLNSAGAYRAIRDVPQNSVWSQDGLYDSDDNRIPVDPWGNPYLFFPPSGETAYNFSSIYCLGPNGLPGDGTFTAPEDYTREGGNVNDPSDDRLGTGDDLEVRF